MVKRYRRLMQVLTLLLLLYNVAAVAYLLTLPSDIADNVALSHHAQIMISVTWVGLFACSMMGLVGGGSTTFCRSNWLIPGFIGYSLLRLFIFSQADYDRHRLPALGGGVGLMLTAYALACMLQGRVMRVDFSQNKEKLTDDGKPQSS